MATANAASTTSTIVVRARRIGTYLDFRSQVYTRTSRNALPRTAVTCKQDYWLF
jgi:hypothetical protein